MVELVLRKRVAKAGEMGLFLETPAFQEEWDTLRVGSEILAECSVPETAQYRKFFYALCGKLADNCDWITDKEDAKEKLLLECRHVTYHFDHLRNRAEIKPKTTRKLTSDQWIRLLRRASHAVVTKFIPGMPENELKDEISQMIGGS